ncbi:MAG: aminotransferase class III-fold pyridoxal phosphate-dependent enzyme [Actinobacteria bacterium]|nr:aminotransferase class III-fold pyridoxal phosphate-dependent enzyme [Actinomycetota bacterium]
MKSLDQIIEAEEQVFLDRVPKSVGLHQQASRSIPGGVPSSWASSRPTPVWVSHGKGAYVWDVDDNRYIDFHAGYGANIVGHANPAIVAAVQKRVTQGTHFAQPTPDSIVVAEELSRRFGLPQWRFCNSGTEATMDAVHLMRAITGRDLIVKVEGSYNGHHDAVAISIFRSAKELGPADKPWRTPGFEPILMGAGIIVPAPGYLAAVKKLVHQHGALLAFDEVKTGLVVHPGGVTAMYGVVPDIVCLAKALGGGLPCGAIGGTNEVMSAITDGRYNQVGTFNGNPLTMAATRAVLTEVLTDDAYAHANEVGAYVLKNAVDILQSHGQGAHGYQFGFKVSVVFCAEPAINYRDFLEVSTGAMHLNYLMQFNGGVFLAPWGKSESLTMSVAHDRSHGDVFLQNLSRLGGVIEQMSERTSEVFAVGSFN